MYRNDTVLPFFAILFSIALFYAFRLDAIHLEQLAGEAKEELTPGQIGLLAFSAVFLVYGLIGYFSTWLEGVELRPGRHVPEPGAAVAVVSVLLAVVLAGLSGFFVRLLLHQMTVGPVSSAAQGVVFGSIMLVAALLLAIYKKYYLGDEVLIEDEHSEVPW